jgi:hypothetical protein
LQNAESLVGTFEETLNISERWTAESPEYKQYHEENVKTKYQEAIDHLERLVVMFIGGIMVFPYFSPMCYALYQVILLVMCCAVDKLKYGAYLIQTHAT